MPMERQKARWRKSEDVSDVLDAQMLGTLGTGFYR